MFGGADLQEPQGKPKAAKGLFDETEDEDGEAPAAAPAAPTTAAQGGPDIRNALAAAIASRVSCCLNSACSHKLPGPAPLTVPGSETGQ